MSSKITLKFGLYWGAASVSLQIIAYLLDWLLSPPLFFSLLHYVVMIGCVVWGMKFYKASSENLSFKEALKIGIGIAISGGFITGIYNIIFVKFIEPDFLEQVLQMKREYLFNQNLNEEQIEKIIAGIKKMSSPFITLGITIITSAFWGFVISVIAGSILKTKKRSPSV